MGELAYLFESADQIEASFPQIAHTAKRGIAGGAVVVTLGREGRTAKQNRWFHALIGDIKKGVSLGHEYSDEAWKALMVDEFEQELASMGRKLSKPSQVVLSFDKQRAISIRPSTTSFGKRIAGEFITFLYCWGAQNGVEFSQESTRIYEEYGIK